MFFFFKETFAEISVFETFVSITGGVSKLLTSFYI